MVDKSMMSEHSIRKKAHPTHDLPILCSSQRNRPSRNVFRIPDQVDIAQALHRLRNKVIQTVLPGLTLLLSNCIVSRILLKTLKQVRVVQPSFCTVEIGDGTESDLGVEMLCEMKMEAAFDETFP